MSVVHKRKNTVVHKRKNSNSIVWPQDITEYQVRAFEEVYSSHKCGTEET